MLAVTPDEQMSDPKLEARARQISHGLRCLVCQNQSIDDSDAPLARDLRLLVRERIKSGDSDGQVIDFIVARYGDFVLLKPPLTWHTALLWATPFLLLDGGDIRDLAQHDAEPCRCRRRASSGCSFRRRARQARGCAQRAALALRGFAARELVRAEAAGFDPGAGVFLLVASVTGRDLGETAQKLSRGEPRLGCLLRALEAFNCRAQARPIGAVART